jgi:hypothetical protein
LVNRHSRKVRNGKDARLERKAIAQLTMNQRTKTMTKQINYKGFGIPYFADHWPAYELEFENLHGFIFDDGWDGCCEYKTLRQAKKAIDRYLKEAD